MKTCFFDAPRPRVMAHRGFSARYPENTLPAFEAAAPVTDTFELDVWQSADGEVVVHHDETLLRTCKDPRPVHQLTLAALRQLDAGWGFTDESGGHPWRGRGIRIPTLREVFRAFPEHRYVVEIKHDVVGLEAAVDALAREAGLAERVFIASEHDAIIGRVRDRFPDYPTNLPVGEVTRFLLCLKKIGQPSFTTKGRALQIPVTYRGHLLATPDVTTGAHAVGLEVHFWTINEPEEMKTLLAMGADGFFTDDPALAVEAVRAVDRRR